MKRLTIVLTIMIASLILILLGKSGGETVVVADEPARPGAQVSEGQIIFEARCAACHGIAGDGAGPGAERLFVKPRDFTRDEYKLKSTAGDEFPTREDLIQVISEGMPGTSMPAWEGILSQSEIGAVADYVQNFGRFFPQEGYGTTLIEIPGRVDPSPESIARGQVMFESDIGCARCHGNAGRGDGPSAFELTDNAGHVIYPADLTQPWTFRGGAEPENIYLRLQTGLTGSPMPSFADSLSPEDTWDLVNYILSLSSGETGEPAVLIVSQFVDGPLPSEPDDPAWNNVPSAYYPLTPQLMRAPRYYQPSINAVRVKSLYNGSEVAFHVAWNDRTETREGEAIDAVALQFPEEVTGEERPYFLFGDSERAVYQWYWAADEDTAVERNGNGIEEVEVQPEEQWQTQAAAQYQDGRWQVVFHRPLAAEDEADLTFVTDYFIPLSFMAWDGGADEAEERLGLTSWSVVYLESPLPVTQYAWIPVVMIAVFIGELLIIWIVRRAVGRPKKG